MPEWNTSNQRNKDNDIGIVLAKIFATLLERVIVRLNKVPLLNFIEFLNTVGINLIPAQPARVPVKFNLSDKVTQNVEIAAGTQVATGEIDKHGVLTFETMEKIVATPAKLVEVYSFGNKNDSIYSHTQDYLQGEDFFVFAGDDDLQEHILYIGDAKLFDIKSNDIVIVVRVVLASPLSEADLKFLKDHLRWEYNWKLDPNTQKEVPDSASEFETSYSPANSNSFEVELTKPEGDNSEIQDNEVNKLKSRWIRCKLNQKLLFSDSDHASKIQILRKGGIQIRVRTKDNSFLSPDLLSYNDIPINVEENKPLYPFGRRPMTLDAFYVASKDAFSKTTSKIALSFEYNDDGGNPLIPLADSQVSAYLSWEYWNGKDWTNIDGAAQNPETQTVEFTCPEDIQPTQVIGKDNYWIRVRIISGNYGELKTISSTEVTWPGPLIKTTYHLSDDDIDAPQLEAIKMKINKENEDEKTGISPEQCLTYNNLQYESHSFKIDDNNDSNDESLSPFFTLQENHPVLYLGFNLEIKDGPINILFSLKERRLSYGLQVSKLDFYYYSDLNKGWIAVKSEDETRGLKKTGIVSLFITEFLARQSIFGKNLFWIKAVDSVDIYSNETATNMVTTLNKVLDQEETFLAPQIRGLYLNTVYALHSARITDEILGSSTGLPNQQFILSKTVSNHSQLQLLVNEGKIFDETEKRQLVEQRIIQEEKPDLQGNIIETWVQWQRVEDIRASGPNDRAFSLDAAFGTIIFGDGRNGKVPPSGDNNIRASYASGGGESGNISPGEIQLVKNPIPFIESVTNPESAEGGLDVEMVENALKRGPNRIKNRGQPIAAEDFEYLVLENFPSLARVKCLATTNEWGHKYKPGYVTIVVIPSSSEDIPIPSLELIDSVEKFLFPISSAAVVGANRLRVISPLYVKVSVIADIYPTSIDFTIEAEKNALDALRKFLHPLNGGPEGKGWELGNILYPGDIYELFKGIHEIDHISNLKILYEEQEFAGNASSRNEKDEENKTFTLETNDISFAAGTKMRPNSLIFSGDHNLTIK